MTAQVTQPLIELVDEREFTDREEELAFFWELAKLQNRPFCRILCLPPLVATT